jgi:anti-anti-sigma factor
MYEYRERGPAEAEDGDVRVIAFTDGRPRDVEDVLARELRGRTGDMVGRHLVLDFTNVTLVGSAELGTLIGLHQRMQESGGKLTLCNLCPELLEVFAVTGLDTFLDVGGLGAPGRQGS